MIELANKDEMPVQSRHHAARDIVLRSMPLKSGTDRLTLSQFGEDRWDLRPAIFQIRARYVPKAIDFGVIDCPVERLVAKEYIYAWLNERLPDRLRRLPPLSVPSELNNLLRFMAFVRERLGWFDAQSIDQALIDEYRASLLKTARPGSDAILRNLRPIVHLHRFAPFLTCGGLPLPPLGGRSLGSVAGVGQRNVENRTPRIPEPVMAAMLRWSLKYVDVFAADIFAARSEWDGLLESHRQRPRAHGSVNARLTAWIDDRRRQGRGIPVWNETLHVAGMPKGGRRTIECEGDVVNMQLITLQCGVSHGSMYRTEVREQLTAALEELGREPGGMETLITVDPDTGEPWRSRFDVVSLGKEEKHLQTAAYILCAYLTGMRDSEVQAMAPGCLHRSRSADGLIERLSIHSMIFKHRGPRGEFGEWITIEPIGRALRVAEKLAERHRHPEGQEDLWLGLDTRSITPARGIGGILAQLNRFRTHLDQQYGEPGAPAIPEVDGRSWWFTTLQFRRTVAWYIANRPFGVIAGKIQYKHASIAMFEGYAGSSASGFRQEVEQQRALGQLDDIVEHYEAHRRGERQAGPAATRLAWEYDHASRALEALPGKVVDRNRLQAMLGHLARTLHVGYLNDCFFEPATALCLIETDDGKPECPVLSRCAPDRCPNSCIRRRHLPAWEEAIAETERLLRMKRLPPLQRTVLRRENDRMRKLIMPLAKDQDHAGG